MDVGCTLDYRLRLWAPTSASRAISAVAELLVIILHKYFSLRRRPTEIILFQCVETCLKLFHNYFRHIVAAHEYFPTCSMSLK